MKEHRNTRQRDAIMDYLSSTRDHPTAETVYNNIREKIPNISLGTVYRNLTVLEEMGQVHRIPQGSEPDRFDADLHGHDHLKCMICGSLTDIELDSSELDTLAAKNSGCDITGHDIIFYGVCQKCKRKNNNS